MRLAQMQINYIIDKLEIIEADLENQLEESPNVRDALGKLQFLLRELKVERDHLDLESYKGGRK